MSDIFLYTSNLGKAEEFRAHFLQTKKNILTFSEIESLSKEKFTSFPEEDSDSFLANGLAKVCHALHCILEYSQRGQQTIPCAILVDDSGLCVPGLDGQPGVHSATYAGEPKDDQKNLDKLKQEISRSPLSFLRFGEKRLDAFFVCFLFYLDLSSFMVEKFSREVLKNFFKASSVVNKNILEIEKNMFTSLFSKEQATGAIREEYSFTKLLNLNDEEKVPLKVCLGYCSGEVSETPMSFGYGHGYDPLFYGKNFLDQSFACLSLAEKAAVSHRGAALGEIERVH